jgi:hypothetical protein
MATIIDIAEAVRAELATGRFSKAFAPTRGYAPQKDLAEMAELQVTVVPRAVEEEIVSRSSLRCSYSIDVAVQQKIDTSTNAQADELMALVEEIKEFFRLRPLASFGAYWQGTECDPIYSPQHWRELGQFTSVITLTFTGMCGRAA